VIKKINSYITKISKKTQDKNICDIYIDGFDKRKCIFIHIPKCAGVSIESALFNSKVGHNYAIQYYLCNPIKFKKYFVFTFVRDPLSRFVSAFRFLKKGGRNQEDCAWAEKNISDISTVDQLIEKMKKKKSFKKKVLSHIHFRRQTRFITDIFGRKIVDFTGKVESINEDFSAVKRKLHVSTKLPHKNSSESNHWSHYIRNKRNVNMVKKWYQKDFEVLGY